MVSYSMQPNFAAALDKVHEMPGYEELHAPVCNQQLSMQGVADVSGFEDFRDWQHCFAEPGDSTDLQESSEVSDNATEALHQSVRDKVRGSRYNMIPGYLERTLFYSIIITTIAASKHQSQEDSPAEQLCAGCSGDGEAQPCGQGKGPLEKHAEVSGAWGGQQGRLFLSRGPHHSAAVTAGGGRHAAQDCISEVWHMWGCCWRIRLSCVIPVWVAELWCVALAAWQVLLGPPWLHACGGNHAL